MIKHYPCLLEASRCSFLVGANKIQHCETSMHAQSIDGVAGKDYWTSRRRFYKHQEFRVRYENKKMFPRLVEGVYRSRGAITIVL